MYTRFNGMAEYPLAFSPDTALSFAVGVYQIALSTPLVRFPLFEVTLFTASSFAENEWVSNHCKAFALWCLPMLIAFAIRHCNDLTLRTTLSQSMKFHRTQNVSGAHDKILLLWFICLFLKKKSYYNFLATEYPVEVCTLSHRPKGLIHTVTAWH
jgi:hypothetical protein